MLLAYITLGFMAVTICAKWFSVTSLQSKRASLADATEQNGQAKYRLKIAVKEVTTTQAEIDKLKRKARTTERKIDRLKTDYQKYSKKAQEEAELNAEKLRLAEEMNKRKGRI